MDKQKIIDFNGEIFPSNTGLVSVEDRGFYYGMSVYETMYVKSQRVAFYEEHLKRLKQSVNYFHFSMADQFYQDLKDRIQKVIQANEIEEGRLRLIVSQTGNKLTSAILIEEIKSPIKEISLIVSMWKKPYPALFPSFVKISSNLISLLSIEEARAKGFDEAIFFTTNGWVSEGSYCNVFFFQENKLYTPSLDCSILEGVTRTKIIESAKQINLEIEEGRYTYTDFMKYEKIFISSSTRGLIPVSRVDDRNYNLSPSPVMDQVQAQYNILLEQSLLLW